MISKTYALLRILTEDIATVVTEVTAHKQFQLSSIKRQIRTEGKVV